MNLQECRWTKTDIADFQKYLKQLENVDKVQWSSNLLKTELPVLAIKTNVLKDIAKQISDGNYLEFLDLMLWEYYENTAINGFVIPKIKDFDTMKKYLDIYSQRVDNWASCDLLKFNVKGKEEQYFNLTLEYIESQQPFVRRIGMSILFNFIDNEQYIDKIFNLLDKFEHEQHYYVNMMNAWLLCECYIKQKKKTLEYLQNNMLNKFTINKAIQKCRDSYRVSIEDKNMLLQYKK